MNEIISERVTKKVIIEHELITVEIYFHFFRRFFFPLALLPELGYVTLTGRRVLPSREYTRPFTNLREQ